MREAIARKNETSKVGVQYKLDLMVWDCSLQPTWLSLPAPPGCVKTAEVALRIFRHGGPQRAKRPSVLAQYLLQLLHLFLTNGPQFILDARHSEHRQPLYPLHLDMLIINLVPMQSPSNSAMNDFLGQKRRPEDFLAAERKAAEELGRYLLCLSKSGLLFGKIRLLRLHYGKSSQRFLVVERGDRTETAKDWAEYGWGPVLRILDCQPPGPNIAVTLFG